VVVAVKKEEMKKVGKALITSDWDKAFGLFPEESNKKKPDEKKVTEDS
jgi:hypothetical protein